MAPAVRDFRAAVLDVAKGTKAGNNVGWGGKNLGMLLDKTYTLPETNIFAPENGWLEY